MKEFPLGLLRDGPSGFGVYGFRKEYHFLSNFYMVDILIPDSDGTPVYYKSSEHYFMSRKPDPHSRWYADNYKKIVEAKTASLAKRYAMPIPKIAHWYEQHRIPAMEKALRHKFAIPEMWFMLDATGDVYLEETNTWDDTFWGVCDGVGTNMLGKLLMKVRDGYRKYGPNPSCDVGTGQGRSDIQGANYCHGSIPARGGYRDGGMEDRTQDAQGRGLHRSTPDGAQGLDIFCEA